ncbi:hypothetical protein LBMAG49_22840 [Planctomycetota bacterium]|nr:hypothetical protein LBMAG49_22840 [Planctomycetota bacterium]
MNRFVAFAIGIVVFGAVAFMCWRAANDSDGGEPVAQPFSAEAAPVSVELPPPTAVLQQSLGPVVNGIIRWPSGKRAAGVRVVLLRQLSAWPEWRRSVLEDELTGADGLFHFKTERKPQQMLQVSCAGYASEVFEAQMQIEQVSVTLRPAFSLSGRVLNDDSVPVLGARVSLEAASFDARQVQTMNGTGSDGRFQFNDVPAGPIRIVARHAAWQPALLAVAVFRDARNLVLRFESPAFSVTGRIIDAVTDQPVGQAEIRGLLPNQDLGRNESEVAHSDANGFFEIKGLCRGGLSLTVRHPAYGTAVRTIAVGSQSAEVLFDLAPSSSLSGRIKAPPGVAVTGAVLLLRSSADELCQAVVDANGAFRFVERITGGWATIEFVGGKFAFNSSGSAALQLRIEEGKDEDLEVAVQLPSMVWGRVLDFLGRPVCGACFWIVQNELVRDRLLQVGTTMLGRNLPKFGVQFTRSAVGGPEVLLAVTDALGEYRIQGLLAGPVSLRVQYPGSGTRQVACEVKRPGIASEPFDVRMEAGGKIDGQISRGGLPLAGLQVEVACEGTVIRAISGIDGRFELTDLSSGRYRVRARSTTGTAMSNPVELATGRHEVVGIEFPRARVVSGKVIGDDREPIVGALVVPFAGMSATTDAEGRFRLELENSSGGSDTPVLLKVFYGDFNKPIAQLNWSNAVGVATIQINTPKLCTIRARVFGLPNHKRIAGVIVRAEPRDAGAGAAARSQWVELQSGNLAQPLLSAGRWRLSLRAEGYAPFLQDVDVAPQSDLQLGEVLLEPGSELRGRLVDVEGRPVAGAEVCLANEDELGKFALRLRSESDGTFVLGGVCSAADNLLVAARGYALTSYRVRLPQDLLAKNPKVLTLHHGASLQVRVGLRLAGIIVLKCRGRVLDSREIDDGSMVVFENLAPGEFTVELVGEEQLPTAVQVGVDSSLVSVQLR